MKKLFLLLLMVVAFCGSAGAQKGMQGIGFDLSICGQKDVAFGGSVKYHYNISDYVRFEPIVSFFKVEEKDNCQMTALTNLHFFFSRPKVVRPYLYLGAGLLQFKNIHGYGDDDLDSVFGVNGGLGLDWRVTHNLSLQFEAGALAGLGDDDYGGAFRVNVGMCYNF